MTWQEQLHWLDREFARGALPAREYEVRRTQILSQMNASAGYPPTAMAYSGEGERIQAGQPWHPGPPVGLRQTPRPRRRPRRPPSSAANPDWVGQGPEEFPGTQAAGQGRTIGYVAAGLALLVVIVLAVISRNSGAPAVDQQAVSDPQPSLQPLPEPPAAKPEPARNSTVLVDPPGQARAGAGDFDLARLTAAKLLPDSVVDQLKQGGMTAGQLKTTTDGPVTLALMALDLPNAQSAANVAREYAYAQQEGGVTASRDLSMHGVPVFTASSTGRGTVVRGVYVLYTRVITVDVSGPQQQARKAFQALLDAQVRSAPPTDRSVN
jgi:hypothetical protein